MAWTPLCSMNCAASGGTELAPRTVRQHPGRHRSGPGQFLQPSWPSGTACRTGNDGARRYRHAMAHVTILDLNLASLRGAVDASTYARGAEYARQRDGLYAAWDPDGDALRGVVRGQENKVYNTAAFFSLTGRLHAEFELG